MENVDIKVVFKIYRSLALKFHNIITIDRLIGLSLACDTLACTELLFTEVLAFLRLSNLAPHAIYHFDHIRYLTGHDVFFTRNYLKLMIKWSKTLQTRDKVQCITLPKLKNRAVCPYRAVKNLRKLYPFTSTTSLLQISNHVGLLRLTNSRVRKVL